MLAEMKGSAEQFVHFDPDPRATIASRVRELRAEDGHTQDELADLAGLNRGHLGEIERGSKNVTLLTIAKIAAVYALEPWQLLRRE